MSVTGADQLSEFPDFSEFQTHEESSHQIDHEMTFAEKRALLNRRTAATARNPIDRRAPESERGEISRRTFRAKKFSCHFLRQSTWERASDSKCVRVHSTLALLICPPIAAHETLMYAAPIPSALPREVFYSFERGRASSAVEHVCFECQRCVLERPYVQSGRARSGTSGALAALCAELSRAQQSQQKFMCESFPWMCALGLGGAADATRDAYVPFLFAKHDSACNCYSRRVTCAQMPPTKKHGTARCRAARREEFSRRIYNILTAIEN